MKQGIIDHESGLKFLPPGGDPMSMGSLGGKTCWGKLLNQPQFTDLEGFSVAVDTLDTVKAVPVYYKAGPLRKTEVEGWKLVVSTKSEKTYGIVSDYYAPVQDTEVAEPFFAAAQARGLNPIGRVDKAGKYGTTGHVVLANPEFTIRLLEDYKDDVMLGVRWWNSYGGDRSFGAEVFGVRTVCINYNLWGSLLGYFRQVHLGAEQDVMARFDEVLQGALNASPILTKVVGHAVDVTVELEMVPDLLWALDLGPVQVATITGDLEAWEPTIPKLGLNAWTLYNAVTAYVTYRPKGGMFMVQTEALTRKANELLEGSHTDLLAKGRKRRKAYEEKVEERERKALQAKAQAATNGGHLLLEVGA